MQNPQSVAETETNQQQDGTIIVPNAKLQEIILANKLPDDIGNRMQALFSGSFATLDEWQTKSAGINITSEDQTDEIELAQQGAKAMLKLRTSIEAQRVKEKKYYLDMGRGIDAVCKALTSFVEPIEADLKAKAAYAVNLAAERKRALVAERKNQLLEIGHTEDVPGLGEFTEQVWATMLLGFKAQAQMAREQAEREQAEQEAAEELERKQAADRLAAEEAERKRVRERESLGRERREALLKVGTDIGWNDLCDLTTSEWQIALATHTNAFEARERAEKERRELRERTADRKLAITALGAKPFLMLGGDGYQLGDVFVGLEQIDRYGNEEWQKVITEFTQEADHLAREAEERIAKERERAAIASRRIAELQQADYTATLEDVADIEEEQYQALLTNAKTTQQAKAAILDRNKARKQLLFELGASWAGKYFLGNAELTSKELEDATEEDWSTIYERFVAAKKEREAAEKKAAEDAAIAAKHAAEEVERKRKAAEDAKAAKRAAAAPDKEKLDQLSRQFDALAKNGFTDAPIQLPTCKTMEGKAIIDGVKTLLGKVADFISTKTEGM